MKWKISKKEFDNLSTDDQNSGFFIVKPVKTIAHTVKNVWKTYKNLPIVERKAQRKYEIFCGGFLYFYDKRLVNYLKDVNNKAGGGGDSILNYLKGKKFNHDLWFEWTTDKKAGKTSVTIYLNPPAGNPDPPPPPAPPPPETST